nr:MAG TPA: hypothetical protein [Caudoviricetes sp.]
MVNLSVQLNSYSVTICLRMLTKNRIRENNYFICKLI